MGFALDLSGRLFLSGMQLAYFSTDVTGVFFGGAVRFVEAEMCRQNLVRAAPTGIVIAGEKTSGRDPFAEVFHAQPELVAHRENSSISSLNAVAICPLKSSPERPEICGQKVPPTKSKKRRKFRGDFAAKSVSKRDAKSAPFRAHICPGILVGIRPLEWHQCRLFFVRGRGCDS